MSSNVEFFWMFVLSLTGRNSFIEYQVNGTNIIALNVVIEHG